MRKWLKAKRIELKKTQQNVADEIGVTKQYYSLIESGQRQKNMSTGIIMSLANCFGMSPVEIVNIETSAEVSDTLESNKA